MATRALLVVFPGYPYAPSHFVPDDGLALLAACLRAEGHAVRIVDLGTPAVMARLFPAHLRRRAAPLAERLIAGELGEADRPDLEAFDGDLGRAMAEEWVRLGRDVAEEARAFRADWVGFKLWNGDGFSGSLTIAREVKRALGVPILAGGPQVDFFMDHLLAEDSPFVAWSHGEGEATVSAFAAWVERGGELADVPNLLVRAPSGEVVRTREERVRDLGALPFPCYDDDVYPALAEGEKARFLVFEESRGCPWKCPFCNHPLKAGAALRLRPVEESVAELSALVRRHGFRRFKFAGSYTPTRHLRALSNAILDAGIQVEFCGYGRVSDAADADFPLFRRAGCRALFFGVESGSQMLLDRTLGKRIQATSTEDVLRSAREAGIFTIASIIYPGPGENAETREATLGLFRRVRPDGAPVHFPALVPSTAWFSEPEKYGFRFERDGDDYVRTLLGYKLRLMFPPALWPPLPYRVDGRPFHAFAADTAEMTSTLERMGVVTLASDETALLGFASGLGPRAFRDRCRREFLTGDADGVRDWIRKVGDAPVEQAA